MTEVAGMYPRKDYPPMMERPPRVFPDRDPAAEAAALAAGTMFDCNRFPGAVRLSERQCLINQERAAAVRFPSFCVDCAEGREIKARHPEGLKGLEIDRHDRVGMPKKPPSPRPSPPRGEGEKPVDRSTDEPANFSPPPRVCAKHQVAMKQDWRSRYYCPQCRGEAHLGGIPLCPIHKMKKTKDKSGRYYCEKCRSAGCREGWATRQKEEKVKKLEVAMCPDHPGQPQKLDHKGLPLGACELCLKTARPGDGRAFLPAVSFWGRENMTAQKTKSLFFHLMGL